MSLKVRITRLITACNLSRNPARSFGKAYTRVYSLAKARSPHLLHLAFALQYQRHIVLARAVNSPKSAVSINRLTRQRDHNLAFYGF